MIRPLNVFTAACLCMLSLQTLAQVAEPLIIPESLKNQRAACFGDGMDAGTILSITALGAQSNQIDADEIILCFGDQILINHSGDADFSDDPDDNTDPGVGYAFYDCPPTISGPELIDVANDACLRDMPMPANNVWVARGNPEGDVVFHNDGSIQRQFFNGSAGILYFAPITITNFEVTPPAFDDGGSCLHVSTDEAFSVIYLNDISLLDFSTPDNSSLSGMLSLAGGYPEYDPSVNYIVTLSKIDDPSIMGTIDAQVTHGGNTTFSVPVAGTYILSVSDPRGCSKEFVVTIPSVDPVQLCLSDISVMTESNFCMPVTVANFTNVLSAAMTIGWDPSVIEFTGVSNVNTTLGSNNVGFDEDRKSEGILPVLFFELSLTTITLPDSAVLFDLCFTVVGPPGSRTPISFLNEPTGISITDSIMDLGVILKPGSVVVSNPTVPTLFYTACANASGDVIFTMQVFGGADPYTYDINSSTTGVDYDNGTIFGGGTTGYQNMPPDIYDIIITDGSGVSIPRTIDLRTITMLQIDTLVSDPSCRGIADGSVEITSISDGTMPYGITWTGSGFTKYGTTLLDELNAGNYNLVVRDANGCTDTLDFTLEENEFRIMTESKNLPECIGLAEGQLSISIIGGNSAAYRYVWKSESGQIIRDVNSGATDQIRNITSGTYSVMVSDGFCEAFDTISLGVSKTMQLQVDSIRLPSCAGDSDAYIGISVYIPINKQGPVFAWSTDAQTVVTSNDTVSIATMVRPGNHSVTISDGACEVDTTFTITEPRPLDLNTQLLRQSPHLVQPACPDGTNGRIDLGFADLIIGGTPLSGTPYNFRWYDLNNGNNTWLNPSRNFSRLRDLSAGFYGVYLEDANGCSDSTVFELVAGPNIDIQLDLENVCRGDSMAQLTVSGDLTGNNLSWSTGANTPTITNLKEGIYYASVTETMGDSTCTSVDSFFIIDPVVAVNTIRDMRFAARSLCNEPDSGIIFNHMIDYSGPIDYIWPSLGGILTGPFISIDSSGTFPFTVIDRITGCIIYDSVVTAQFPEMISLEIDTTPVSCFGSTDGSILITASGRSGAFNFNWSSGFTDNNSSSSTAQPLRAGIYQVTVTESTDSTCSVPLTISIPQPDSLILSLDSAFTQDIRCFGDGDGQIGLIWQGGNQDAAPTIDWSAGGASNTLSATGLDAGIYDIVLTDSKGCTGMVTHMIAEPGELFATVPVPDNPVCNGFQTTLTVTGAIGGTGSNYLFSVDNGPAQMINSLIPVFAGDHVITVFDERGCQYDTLLSIIDPEPVIVDLGPDLTVALGDSVRLNALVDGPSTIDSYIWTPDQLLSCNNCDAPFANPVEDQLFELIVVDINGCEGQDQIRLSVDKARLVYIPNGFTPNGDGVNDKWQIFTGPGVRQILGTHVFDRWGNLVFESGQEPPPMRFGSAGWDGRADNGLMNPGVYVYLVQVEFIDGRIFTYRGDVTMAH